MYNHSDMLNRIKYIKKLKNITTDILSEKTSIPKSTLSKILAGITRDPQISNIIKIAEALEVSADYIILGTENILSDSDKILLHAYHAHPEMQPAVDRILGIGSDVSDTISSDIASDIKPMLTLKNTK